MADNEVTEAQIPNQSLTVSDAKQRGTREPADRSMKTNLPLAADDGWDMSPRREADIMLDMPTTFEPITPERPIPTARGVLSAAEIEALLRPDLDDMPEPDPEPEQITAMPVAELPAKPAATPTELSEDARRIASRLSLALRDGCGLKAAAIARASARAAERAMTKAASEADINPQALAYINRLSDFLFVIARVLNDNGASDVKWVPGANR